MLTHSVCSSILLSTQSVITAAPLICLAASVACVYVSRNGWVRKIGERTEVDNCGPGVAQRPEDSRRVETLTTSEAMHRCVVCASRLCGVEAT